MLLVEFVMEFIYLHFCACQGAFARCRDGVEALLPAGHCLDGRPQEAASLQAVEQRVEGSRADPVSVVFELIHHRQAKDGPVSGVDQHVNSDKAGKEIPLRAFHRSTISLW